MKKIIFFLVFGFSGIANAQMQVHTVSVKSNDLVYDSNTGKIYISVPSANGSNGNSIGVVNPNTYSIDTTVFMGSEPSVLAISENGQYIYCGFTNSSKIRRFNVANQTAGLQIILGEDQFLGLRYANDIAVLPGQPNSIAVSRKYKNVFPYFAGLAIYDDSVQRPITFNWGSTTGIGTNKIEFKNDTTLFGYNNESSSFDFCKLVINADEVSLVSTSGISSSNLFDLDFKYYNNNAYFTDGSVVDVTTVPYINGVFQDVNGPVVYDSYNNLVCFAYSINGTTTFKRYNPYTFLSYDSLLIPNVVGKAKNLITCGNGCYAFNTSDNKIIIIKNGSLGLNEIQKRSISIYPNPTSDYIFVNSEIEINRIEILDLSGRMINNIDFADHKLFVGDLQAGIYVAKIYDVKGIITTEKIIKK